MKLVNYFLLLTLLGSSALPASALEYRSFSKITVNSNRDEIKADNDLTLREAIAIINGDLKQEQLSPAEQKQIQDITPNSRNHIEFQLSSGNQKIELKSALPNLVKDSVQIEGKTTRKATLDGLTFETPEVEITPASGVMIDRGLTLMADNITVKGLSLYGFQVGINPSSQNLPGADIFIGTKTYPEIDERLAPKNIVIENNFLGINKNRQMPDNTSDFGVYVFDSQGTTIRNNAIGFHTASGIISQISANNLLVENNAVFANGTQGMPDAIRLEGKLANNKIKGNAICGNDGSAVFMFKPDSGAVAITNNRISSNGRRLRRAAIHLMGNDNVVDNNSIEFQAGSGVSVSAFAQHHKGDLPSGRNVINNNRFSNLEGLSVDLITYRNEAVEDFQNGDGINAPRNSENRRIDTGNGAINAPQFLANEFYILGGRVNLDGTAEPNTKVEIYRVNSTKNTEYGPLSQSLKTVTADAKGKFQATITGLEPGMVLSAVTTDAKYGTSEPARNAIVTVPGQTALARSINKIPTDCSLQDVPVAVNPPLVAPPVTPPIAPPKPPVVPPTPVEPPIPSIVKISIPQKVHFALDKSHLSPATTKLLDEIVRVLKANPSISIDLAGHTDPRAPQAYNQALGMRRATSVRNYLLRKGISTNRMTIRSMSFNNRATTDQGVNPYALDRRVEFEYRDVRGVELQVIDRFDDLQPER
jgi:outer membrane protein OmpA-like peptidoglycan-associated protein